ncbi:ABC transporter ATP-binding protein [Azorhizobium oxalatiphilum]|uniref:ABC transporter ATP-binding protein n=1 Tax=Azorhizobium oxalatiphilum TaxID=980631 RepID=A0A917BKD3_9HYPH|nr:ABC transporter ATP-binding protein [Azorhizobium oxalatiphilum]GGF47413.1 ABC transporter ATP-binding protein [Azorhizobium oxalatiphilum]
MLHVPVTGSSESAAGEGFLSVRGLNKRYGDFIAVDNLDLDLPKGELVAFLGPSGCGKTTSLRMIAGLVPATSGRIVVGGRDLTTVEPYRRDMGLVFQSYALFPHMSIAENVAFGLKMRKVGRAETEQRVREAISMVRLTGKESHRPAQLSGGQQQRVALARALVIRPSILLLDEPLSNLDAKLRDEMRNEIRDIQQRLGITAIFVTHDQAEALTMCDKVAVMNAGRLEQLGTPVELYEKPQSPFVASFIGRTNRFAAVAKNGAAELAGLSIPTPAGMTGKVEVMIRPHRITLSAPADGAPCHAVEGVVTRSIFAGDILQYEVVAHGATFLVEQGTAAHERPLEQGSPVRLHWLMSDTYVFGAAA